LKQATLILALLGAFALAGCGSGSGNGDTTSQTTFNNGSGNQPFKPTTHLNHRSLVSNYFSGQLSGELDVMDTTQDRKTDFTFGVGAQPTYLQPSPDSTLTLVNDTGSNTISSFNNNEEAIKAAINLGGWTESFVTSMSNKFGFAAVYNLSNGNPPNLPGGIVRFNPTDGSLNTAIPFPNVRYLSLDKAEKHLLAFTDVDDNAHWVDLTTINATTEVPAVSVLALPSGTLSRPVTSFFTADSTTTATSGGTTTTTYTATAFVLNCGLECGGNSSPSVVELNIAEVQKTTSGVTTVTNTATVGHAWPVNGARIGLIDVTANKLYVAGSTGTNLTDAGGYNVRDGYFTVIDLTALTASAPIRTGNGVKRWIRNINGVFWVASLNCGVQSCVTLVNPGAGSATVLPIANGNATGISLAANSGEVYTIEGGQLYIYTQNASPVLSQNTTDIVGQGSDVLYIN
jgi:hypothetical protein